MTEAVNIDQSTRFFFLDNLEVKKTPLPSFCLKRYEKSKFCSSWPVLLRTTYDSLRESGWTASRSHTLPNQPTYQNVGMKNYLEPRAVNSYLVSNCSMVNVVPTNFWGSLCYQLGIALYGLHMTWYPCRIQWKRLLFLLGRQVYNISWRNAYWKTWTGILGSKQIINIIAIIF